MEKRIVNLIKLSASVVAVALFIPTSVSTANTKSAIALKDAAKTSLSTIFGGNTKDFGRVNHILSVSEIISKLRQAITNSNYIPVINELIVSSPANTGGNTYTSNISVDGNSTEFDGTLTITFVYDNTKIALSTVISTTDMQSFPGWSEMPSMKTFLVEVQSMQGNGSLDLNQVTVDMGQAGYDVSMSRFKVRITPKINTPLYTGEVWMMWQMTKASLASSFPITNITTPYAFVVAASEFYAADPLQAACEQNNVNPADITAFGYTISTTAVGTGGTITISITGASNPRWSLSSVTLNYTIADLGHFDLNSTQLTEQGWTGLTSGGMRFVITDNINNHVIMGNGSHYAGASMTTITGEDVNIPSTIRSTVNGVTKTYTVTGFDKGTASRGGSSGFFGASVRKLRFPSTMNCFLPKDCFRSMSPTLEEIVFDQASIVTGSSVNELKGFGGNTFYDSFPTSSSAGILDLPASFALWGRDYFLTGKCPAKVIMRNPNKVVSTKDDSAVESGGTIPSKRITFYVPGNLLTAYGADSFWGKTGANWEFKNISSYS